MTADEKDMAAMLYRGAKLGEIAKKYGCNVRTIQRRKSTPEFARYMKALTGEVSIRSEALISEMREAVAMVLWNREESARRKLDIADDRNAKDVDRLAAIKALDEMYGIVGVQGANPNPDGEAPMKPDIYRAEWMRESRSN